MNILKIKHLWLFLFVCLMATSSSVMAQKASKEDTKEPKEKKVRKKKEPKEPKEKKEKRVKPSKHSESPEALSARLSTMDRDEKNSVANCPLHNRHMSLSDNYRADASEYEPGEHYPFAYQLNYRRYCNACTRIMAKEAKVTAAEVDEFNKHRAVYERCDLHNDKLLHNPDQDKVDYERSPAADMPHAKQYLLKDYCNTCTKVYKIQMKN